MKTTASTYQSIFIAILALAVLIPASSYSQLFIKENSEVSVFNTLSSKEVDNIFNASITGSGNLHFNNDLSQNLKSDLKINTPDINIDNVHSFIIYNAMFVKGNLNLSNTNLTLFDYLYLDGIIKTQENFSVLGKDLLKENHSSQHHKLSAVNGNKILNSLNFVSTEESKTQIVLDLPLEKQTNTFYKNTFYYNKALKPITPPPKRV